MRSVENSFSFRVRDKRCNHLLVSHEISVSLAVSRDHFDEYGGNFVVNPKLLIVGWSRVLRRACGMQRVLLGKKNVGVDSPFYLGVAFALNSVTVVVNDAVRRASAIIESNPGRFALLPEIPRSQ